MTKTIKQVKQAILNNEYEPDFIHQISDKDPKDLDEILEKVRLTQDNEKIIKSLNNKFKYDLTNAYLTETFLTEHQIGFFLRAIEYEKFTPMEVMSKMEVFLELAK